MQTVLAVAAGVVVGHAVLAVPFKLRFFVIDLVDAVMWRNTLRRERIARAAYAGQPQPAPAEHDTPAAQLPSKS